MWLWSAARGPIRKRALRNVPSRQAKSTAGLLSIGSNIAPRRWIPRAIVLIQKRFRCVEVSRVYQSQAAGPSAGSADFFNLAAKIETDLPLRALKMACRHIEFLCDRVRGSDKYAPRTLDVDPVWCAHGERVTWVDPELSTADYVFVPCAELMPKLVVGEAKQTLRARAAKLVPPWSPVSFDIDVVSRQQGDHA